MAIPFSSVDRYAVRFGFDGPDEFERLVLFIRRMDGAFLKWVKARPGA